MIAGGVKFARGGPRKCIGYERGDEANTCIPLRTRYMPTVVNACQPTSARPPAPTCGADLSDFDLSLLFIESDWIRTCNSHLKHHLLRIARSRSLFFPCLSGSGPH